MKCREEKKKREKALCNLNSLQQAAYAVGVTEEC